MFSWPGFSHRGRHDRPHLSPLLLLRPQRIDLSGRLGPGVWQCLRQYRLLRIPRNRGVHAGAGRRQLRRWNMGGSALRRPARVAAQGVRLFRAGGRLDGPCHLDAPASPGSSLGARVLLLARRERLVRPLDGLLRRPRSDRHRFAHADHAVDGRHADSAHSPSRRKGPRGGEPANRRSLRRQHRGRGVGLLSDGLFAGACRRSSRHPDACGVLQHRCGGGRVRSGARPGVRRDAGTGRQGCQARCCWRQYSNRGPVAAGIVGSRMDQRSPLAVRLRGDGDGNPLVPSFHAPAGRIPSRVLPTAHGHPGRHRCGLACRRLPASPHRSAGAVVDDRTGPFRRLHSFGAGHGQFGEHQGRGVRQSRLSSSGGSCGRGAARRGI